MLRETRANTPPFSSNVERLSIREWLGVILALAGLAALAGPVWNRTEVFEPSSDFRIPYDLSEDYWFFNRACERAAAEGRIFVIGDSFVWGQHVERGHTLPSFLNLESASVRFVNAGLDGSHPLALEGLIRHHCTALRDRDVVLHLNLLWLSSPQADLRSERGTRVNHPRLLPQFTPAVTGYRAPISERIGVSLARRAPFMDWARHLRIAYLSGKDLPRWTLENPYGNPFRQIAPTRFHPEDSLRPSGEPWFTGGTILQDPPWVSMETSLQWQAFGRLLDLLEARGNRVFVLIGPLNEHMLEPSAASAYREILALAESWLASRGIPHHTPKVLPSEHYADLSHPLPEGYATLAGELWTRLSRLVGSQSPFHPGPPSRTD